MSGWYSVLRTPYVLSFSEDSARALAPAPSRLVLFATPSISSAHNLASPAHDRCVNPASLAIRILKYQGPDQKGEAVDAHHQRSRQEWSRYGRSGADRGPGDQDEKTAPILTAAIPSVQARHASFPCSPSASSST